MVNNIEQSQKYFKKGFSKQREKDYGAAEDFYKRALRYNPLHLDANYLLGTLYAERRDFIKALKYLSQASEINPRSHLILNNLGNIYQMSGQYDKAIMNYQQALKMHPNMPEVLNNLGNICKRRDQFSEAESYYRRALFLKPDFVDIHFNLGSVLCSLKKFAEAIDNFRKVLELSPGYAAAYEKMGVCYAELGERDIAIQNFNRCLELGAGDIGEVNLWLAKLNAGDMPQRYPESVMLDTYERRAASWDADFQQPGKEFFGPGHVREILERLQFPKERQLDVLDVGCGTGICGEYLRLYSRHLEGVDLSPHMLEQARRKGLYDNLECAEATAFMQECKQKFDLLVASGVLILFGDLSPVFRAAVDLLKPGGVFVFTLYRSETEAVMVRHNLHFAHSEAYLKKTAREAGLETEILEQNVHEYQNGEAQPGWIVVLRKAG